MNNGLSNLILFSCQQYAKSYDPNLSDEERKEIIAEVVHYNDVIHSRLKHEQNKELIKTLWRNLACSMGFNQVYQSFIDSAGIDEEAEWFKFNTSFTLDGYYNLISWEGCTNESIYIKN